MDCVNFCVIERPYAVWSESILSESKQFLEGIDHEFYLSMARRILADENLALGSEAQLTEAQIKGRKDVAALSRLLRHHGIETLVMLWGAFLQAPHAPHAYFLKSKTEDIRKMSQLLIQDIPPKFLRLKNQDVTLKRIIKSIHLETPYSKDDAYMDRLTHVARRMLESLTNPDHQDEYNSLKHGLRTRHGGFQLRIGAEENPISPIDDTCMELVGFSHDASWFHVSRPLKNSTKSQSRINFQIEDVVIPWPLEKTLCDLQLLSILIANTVSTLRIVCGTQPKDVKFHRPIDADDWWNRYDAFGNTGVLRWAMLSNIDVNDFIPKTERDILNSYKTD